MSDSKKKRLKVVLCWHMHQPEYCAGGEYKQPWTYLHAIKDYTDMAAHLEAVPEARAVVNFSPVLLEQLLDYEEQLRGFFADKNDIRDPLLAALAAKVLPADVDGRTRLVKACLRANKKHLIGRFPEFQHLADIAACVEEKPEFMYYINRQYLNDLLMWYHLAWLGETVRRKDRRVQQLIEKGKKFTLQDRLYLLKVISELIAGIIPRYRALHQSGQVELSMTPYAHPMMPLLLDFHSAREALPHCALPKKRHYPGGEERVRWHIRKGLESFERCFGFRPQGCWPSEGGISTIVLRILEEYGIQWTASGESVLRNSLYKSIAEDQTASRPYHLPDSRISCFFRDDGLSDLIGFEYAKWHADHAVADLVKKLEHVANTVKNPRKRVVSIIMDGENAWEHYPENAFYFLSALYLRLTEHPLLELTTFSECLQQPHAAELSKLVAGSWVYGTFSTWIGDADKNRAWDMLCDAKRIFDKVIDTCDEAQRVAAERQLAVCEGSDWFWWFGDYNPTQSVEDFDRLYRLQLANLYQLLGAEPPDYLAHAFSHGGGEPETGGVMRPGREGRL
ncbi:MAG: glycoside hydrolase [Gammaproteobacteria bacterium]|nr:glycoside hydrolase [Gammaproteobacteria bacterium]